MTWLNWQPASETGASGMGWVCTGDLHDAAELPSRVGGTSTCAAMCCLTIVLLPNSSCQTQPQVQMERVKTRQAVCDEKADAIVTAKTHLRESIAPEKGTH